MKEKYTEPEQTENVTVEQVPNYKTLGRALIGYAGTESEADLPDIPRVPNEYWANMPG